MVYSQDRSVRAHQYLRGVIKMNPELEALRSKALVKASPESQDWIPNLAKRTTNIHAGYLFQNLKTLQDLCLYIGETPNKIKDAGWQVFGYHLGLNISLLKVIKNHNFTQEDPCYNVLLAYVQYDNASVGRIIEVLHKMGRIDVLSRMRHSLNGLADVVLNSGASVNNNSEETSDYESLSTSEGSQSCESNISTSNNDVFLRPEVIPPAPFIFQNLRLNTGAHQSGVRETLSTSSGARQDREDSRGSAVFQKVGNYTKSGDNRSSNETLRNNSTNSVNRMENYNSPRKKRYGLKMFLTFAEDGEKYAEKIAKELRRKQGNNSSIGVLILREHSERVNMDPQKFIEGAFHQVDYVCPIITPGYYKLVTKQEKVHWSAHQSHMDAYYVPYIYRLMNSYFIANDCLNDKIRCIMAEDAFKSVPQGFLAVNPIFGAWVQLGEVDELAKRLMKSRDPNE